MRTKFSEILTLILVFVVHFTFAQEKSISGTITDDKGLPLPGVNIVVKGSSTGTQSDFDGNYSIQTAKGNILSFSYLGFKTQDITVGDSNTINIQLYADASELEEVVVTAQGISRQKKSLGYAVTTLKSDAVESRPEADIGRVLSGKISGVNVVSTGGVAGSGTNINIRGNVSITGNNQPLFVVNGIPFNSSTNAESNVTTGNGSVSASSRFLDIDPNSITDISVLKGLSATVLYGDAGRNGVILVTTKTGSTALVNKGFEVTLNQSVFVNEIANLPDYQNSYGQGGDDKINQGFIGTWGARFDGVSTHPHHYNVARLASSFPEYQGVDVIYQPYKNNISGFLREGFGTTTSLNVSKSTEDISYNVNFGHTDEDGYVPGNNITRTNFGIGGTVKLSNKMKVNASFNFATSDFTTPPISANGGSGNFSVFQRLLFLPRSFDLNGLPFQDPITGANVFYRTDLENPRWLANNAKESIINNRFYNSINTSYDLNDHLTLSYRLGFDTYTEKQQFHVNKGGVTGLLAQRGFLRTTSGTNNVWDHSLILNIKNIALSEKIGLNGTLGFNANSQTFDKFGIVSTQQVVYGFIDHSNFDTQSNVDPLGASLDFRNKRNTLGLYGQFQFDYEDYLYLTLSGRNDWSSTIEKDNRTLFYPSTSLAFVPTSAFPSLKSSALSFLKLRFGYGTSAGFPGVYNTRATLGQTTNAFTTRDGTKVNTNSNSRFFPNANLKAELHREYELGVETRLLNNRVNLEVSVYQRDSKDQILQNTLDSSTGFNATFINAGQIETQGIEIDLGLTPIKSATDDGFNWTSNYSFSASENEVKELPGGNDIFIAGFTNQGNYAIEGEPLGVIRGSYAVRDNEGNFLIDPATGKVFESSTSGLPDRIIGDPNPDWKMTTINTFSYKGFSLSGQVEYTHGGDFSSSTIESLLRRGVTKDTEDRNGTTVVAGVLGDPQTGQPLLDSSGNKIPNQIQISTNDSYFLNVLDPAEQTIFDGSVVRLREVSLSYGLPKKFLDNTPLGSLSFTILGQNLWYWAPNVPKYTNFDPEVISTGVGNGAGLDLLTAPSSKKYGFSIKATF